MSDKQLILVFKRLILVGLTIFAFFNITLSLIASWGQPQIQSRLELYQTNLLLHAAQFQEKKVDVPTAKDSTKELTTVREALIGKEPFKEAEKQYKEARQEAQSTQKEIIANIEKISSSDLAERTDVAKSNLPFSTRGKLTAASPEKQQLNNSLLQVNQLIDELDLRLGIFQVEQGEIKAATKTWNDLSKRSSASLEIGQTAAILTNLWSNPPRLLPDAEAIIQKNLDSWFRYRALTKLYQLQQRQDALLSLQTKEQAIAQQAILKLTLIGVIPGIGGLLGVGLLLFLLIQRLLQGQKSILSTNGDVAWETPWDAEIIWQVIIVGFFFVGQLLLPLLFSLLGFNPTGLTVRDKAFYVLLSYLLLAAGGLSVLYFSIKPFLPISQDWFRFTLKNNWILWGVGGYLVALPLVIIVSLINQQIWQGQGGSNPILPLALEGKDSIALLIFFLTAAVAAPIFEEIIFRGFLLPSLTRYMPVWAAIVASSLLFAIAHLSLSEVLPLATLGMILGFVYTRSRNLLAPMLLHSLWNSGTLLSLFVLGSGTN